MCTQAGRKGAGEEDETAGESKKPLRVAADSRSFSAMSIIGQEERGGALVESATWAEGGGGGGGGGR